jgi:hypothetical protein
MQIRKWKDSEGVLWWREEEGLWVGKPRRVTSVKEEKRGICDFDQPMQYLRYCASESWKVRRAFGEPRRKEATRNKFAGIFARL